MLTHQAIQASLKRSQMEAEGQPPPRPRRPWWEYGIVGAVALAAAWYIFLAAVAQVEHVRQIQLRQELRQIRNAVILYAGLYKMPPPDLATLARVQVEDHAGGQPFRLIEGVRLDARGQMIDPLGYPYLYDRDAGTVRSQAPCCCYW